LGQQAFVPQDANTQPQQIAHSQIRFVVPGMIGKTQFEVQHRLIAVDDGAQVGAEQSY
jgi:hypothetical protein